MTNENESAVEVSTYIVKHLNGYIYSTSASSVADVYVADLIYIWSSS